MGPLALRNCMRQAYDNGAVQGGACTPGTGLDSQGEPNMTLSAPPSIGTAGSATELQTTPVPSSVTYAAVPGSDPGIRMNPDGSQSTVSLPAGFNSASGVATDQQGNLYVAAADGNAAQVYVVPGGTGRPWSSPTRPRPRARGWPSTPAAASSPPIRATTPSWCRANLPASGLNNLSLNDPTGIAVDQHETTTQNVYVADTGNNRVVRINHVAGNWIQTTVASGLSRPQGVAVDTSGNLFIADTGNNRILEVSNYGLGATTVIPTYGLNGPTSVSVGQGGTIVVADTGNKRVVELLPDGSQLDLATGVAATGTAIAPPPTQVFVRDETNQQIWAVGSNGSRTALPVSAGTTYCPSGCRSFLPQAETMDGQGDLYVAELGTYNNNFGTFIFKFPPGGGQTVVSSPGFEVTNSMAADAAGDLWLNQAGSLYKITAGGGMSPPLAPLAPSSDVTVDGAGDVFVTVPLNPDPVTGRIADTALYELPNGGTSLVRVPQGPLYDYAAIAAGPNGMLYAYDDVNQDLIQRAPNGTDTVVDSWSSGDIKNPSPDDISAVAVDASGDVYVTDEGTNQLLEEIPTGSGWQRHLLASGSGFAPLGVAVGPAGSSLANTQGVVLTATVRSDPFDSSATTPTGTVTFYDAGQEIGVAPVLGGVATFTTTTLGGGPHDITAIYSGDTKFGSSTSGGGPLQIQPLVTSTTLSAGAASSTWGQPVALTATVATPTGALAATGPVTFTDGSVTLGTATLSGTIPDTATLTLASLAAGPHQITASYAAQPNFAPSQSSPVAVTVTGQTTTVTVQTSNASPGFASPVVLTASVSPNPSSQPGSPGALTPLTGSVTFSDNGTVIGTATVKSANPTTATLTTSALTVGGHQITAVYSGDGNFAGATSGARPVTVGAGGDRRLAAGHPQPRPGRLRRRHRQQPGGRAVAGGRADRRGQRPQRTARRGR